MISLDEVERSLKEIRRLKRTVEPLPTFQAESMGEEEATASERGSVDRCTMSTYVSGSSALNWKPPPHQFVTPVGKYSRRFRSSTVTEPGNFLPRSSEQPTTSHHPAVQQHQLTGDSMKLSGNQGKVFPVLTRNLSSSYLASLL